jgi:predicted secreted protein
MTNNKILLIILCTCCGLISSFVSRAELLDQGLNSIMVIIDKAIIEVNKSVDATADFAETGAATKVAASSTIVSLSRTLGSLSYSRLQCDEVAVLAEFHQRVALVPEEAKDKMRSAFQEGFDKSAKDAILLSKDECKSLTQSRKLVVVVDEINVIEDDKLKTKNKRVAKVEKPPEDPKLSHLRVAELTGQLAYKHKACSGDKVFNRDYNNFIETAPKEYQEEVKTAYWKGFKHGKRLNKNLTSEQC